MGHAITQVLGTPLPMDFYGTCTVDLLKNLEHVGYIRATFSSPPNDGPARATVTEITPLGRAVARYVGIDGGIARRT